MPRVIVVILIAVLAAVAARQALHPSPGSPAAHQLFAVAGFAFLVLALVAVLWDRGRRRKESREAEVGSSLLDPGNRRETFRIPYPETERPVLRLTGAHRSIPTDEALEVLDLSEKGARVRLPAGSELRGTVEGELSLPGGDRAAIVGTVVRCAGGEAGLDFTQALPATLLFEEQRRLRSYLRRASTPPSPRNPQE
jgi:hypothetical protein